LREDLTAALRDRDRERIRVLRTALAAIANAEAQPAGADRPMRARPASVIAGAVEGLAATEVARRHLDADEIVAILVAERDERLATAEELDACGACDAADSLRSEAAVLEPYLS
jgi:uncharacterized protein YqeY